jgi:hypothetical protein
MKRSAHNDIVNDLKREIDRQKLRAMTAEGKLRIVQKEFAAFKQRVSPLPAAEEAQGESFHSSSTTTTTQSQTNKIPSYIN